MNRHSCVTPRPHHNRHHRNNHNPRECSRIVDKVVDVPVNMQAKLQQSLLINSGLLLRSSISTECWTFQFCHRDRYAQCQTVQYTGDSTGAVLGKVVDTPVDVSTTGRWSRQCSLEVPWSTSTTETFGRISCFFYVCWTRILKCAFALEIWTRVSHLENWTSSLRAPCIWQPLHLCVATINGSFWTNFPRFLREK